MSFTVEHVEFYLLVLIRITSFVIGAPIFGYQTIPMKIRLAIGMVLSLAAIQTVPVIELNYVGVLGFSVLVLKEMIVGLTIGFMCNMCTYIVSFAGQLMDMEMGLSMASTFDPLTNIQVSISGNLYVHLVMLMMLISNMHYKILQAILDTFTYFNVGQAVFDGNLQEISCRIYCQLFSRWFPHRASGICLYACDQCRAWCTVESDSADEYVCRRNSDQGFGRYRNFADYCAYHTDNR